MDSFSFDKNVLLYSEFCTHSKTFLQALVKSPQPLLDSFIKINIDADPATGLRPALLKTIVNAMQVEITSVPTIIVEHGEYMLAGAEAFKWLEWKTAKARSDNNGQAPASDNFTQDGLSAYNPLEMGGFSDPYSKYFADGNTPLSSSEVHDQSFKFIHKNDVKIETPGEDTIEKKDVKVPTYEPIPVAVPSAPRQISTLSWDNNNNNAQSSQSHSKDLDMRLQKLLNERDATVPGPKRMDPQNIDFLTGTIRN